MKMMERKSTKLVAILLALIMCIGLMPTMAFAAAATYTKAATVEDGAQYLLVAKGSSSNYYALKASSGSIGKQQVTISDNAISLDDADCVWTATVSEGKATFKNGSNYIKRSSSTLSLGSSSAAEWSYDGSALTTKGSSNTYYMVYSSGFKASTSSGSNVVLYKLGTSGGGDDADVEVTPTTENPTSDYSIEVGEDFTIEVTNGSSSSGYDYTITFGTAGVAEADETSVNIAKGSTGTFKVTGLKDGTTTITISNNNSSSERKATINLTVGEGGSENPPAGDGTVIELTPTTDNPTESISISVGGSFTVELTNGGSSEYTFTATSSQSGIVNLSETSVKLAKGASTDIVVTGAAKGTTTITIQNSNSYSSSYIRKGTINVTVTGEGGETPPAGGDDDLYLIISNGYALSSKTAGSYSTSGGSYTGYQGVAYSGSTTVTSDMLWEVEMDGSSYTITQNGKTLSGTYTSGTGGDLVLGTTSATWTYSDNHLKIGTGYLTHSDGTNGVSGNPNVFSMRSSSNAGDVEFVKYDNGGSENPPSGDATYLAFCSDVHNDSDNSSADRLTSWINAVTKTLGSKLTEFGFCGDLGPASGTFWSYAQKVMDSVTNSTNVIGNGFYVCGNHEYSPGNFSSTTNETTKRYTTNGNYVETDDYVLYSMGVTSSATWNKFDTADITKLGNYLSTAPTDKPIFVLSHFPLHNYSSRTITNKDTVISTLNEYADTHTIIFLWGHNHTEADTHYNQFYTNTLEGTAIKFTYCSAGCLADDNYGSSSAVNNTCLVAAIDGDTLTLAYYKTNGTATGKSTTVKLNREDTGTYYTITASAGSNGTISPAGEKKVKEGKSQTFTFNASAGYEVNTVTVDGKTVTVSGNKYEFTNVTEDHTISVSFKKAAETVYEAATEMGVGSYVLVSNGYALYNDGGKIAAVPVTVNGNKISVKNTDIAGATWTVSAATGTDKSGDYEIKNDGYYFTRVSDASGSSMAADITNTPTISDASGLPYYQWSYSVANGQLSHIGGQDQSATFYAYYNTSESAFYTTTDEEGMKLYVVSTEQPEINPDVDNKTNETASYDFVEGKLSVDCEKACVVLAKVGDKYTALTAVKVDDDTYTFDYSKISGEFTLVIVLKGDANLDGKITMQDATAVMMSWVNDTSLGGAADYAVNVDGKEGIAMSDATAIMMAWVNETNFAWN